jgi:hypothetical protein
MHWRSQLHETKAGASENANDYLSLHCKPDAINDGAAMIAAPSPIYLGCPVEPLAGPTPVFELVGAARVSGAGLAG